MLPSAAEAGESDPSKPGKYVDTGVQVLQAELIEAGASVDDIRAKVAGGSDMLGFSNGPTVGERNASTARAELDARGIRIVSTDTGGEQGRSLEFDLESSELLVSGADGTTTVL
jgi:chemotaxis protein CheD